ncbi:DegV family protein [Peptacetobacter sp.]|uniref:DegV family protein n=1 Tax=Peptacetobacter sp. TaxID=2991975 RepID=UPI002618C963|nr:DegV family protein [Peptacetobacter sp.]
MNIQLLCDSLCDIPEEIIEKPYLEIVPLTVMFDNREFKDGIDISKEEFYERVKSTGEIPKTSQATYIDFKEVFDKYTSQGKKIICITGSSKSSGTFQSASLAKDDCNEGDIKVFDTLNLSLGSGQYVIKACEMLEEGKSYEEIIDGLETMRESVKLLFVPSTLTYLQKSGRVPSATAMIGNLLHVKPLFNVENGDIKMLEKIRGSKRVPSIMVDTLIKMNNGNLEDKIVTIGCGSNYEDVKGLEEEVRKKIKARKVMFTRGGVCICSHTGPDIIALSSSI